MKKIPGPMTAIEAMKFFASDPEFVSRQKERELEMAERLTKLRAEEEPILSDLREVGYNLESVWDFVNSSNHYESAIPILLKHMLLPYSFRIKEGLARSLATKQAKHLWPIFVNEFCKTSYHEFRNYKDGLAVALNATVTSETMEEMISLAKDKIHGSARVLLLRSIKRSKLPIARQALEELLSDPELAKASVFKTNKPKQ